MRPAVEEIKANSRPSSTIETLVADLSSQGDIKRLAEEVASASRLDVLVNNTGGIFLKRQENRRNRTDVCVQPPLIFPAHQAAVAAARTSSPARIVSVAPMPTRAFRWILTTSKERSFGGCRADQRRRLANILFTYELARRLEGTGVTANTLHPGFVKTTIFREPGPIGWLLRRAADVIALSPEDGAKTSIYLASSPEVAGISGRYFVKRNPG